MFLLFPKGELSELGEILNFLDQEAAVSQKPVKIKKTVMHEEQSTSLSSGAPLLPPTPVRKDIELAAKDLQAVFGLVPPRPLFPVEESARSTYSNTAAPKIATDILPPVPPITSSAPQSKVAPTNAPTNRSGAAPVSNQPRGPHRGRAEYAMQDSKKESSSEGEESGDDDDDNWRKRRQNMRQKVDMKPAEEAVPGGGGKIWGAYSAKNTSTTVGTVREASEDILEVVKAIQEREDAVASEDGEESEEEQVASSKEPKNISVSQHEDAELNMEVKGIKQIAEKIVEVVDTATTIVSTDATVPAAADIAPAAPSTPVKHVASSEVVVESPTTPSVSGSLSGSLLGQGRRAKGGSKGIMSSSTRATARPSATVVAAPVAEDKVETEEVTSVSTIPEPTVVETAAIDVITPSTTVEPAVQEPLVEEPIPQVDPYEQLVKQKLVVNANSYSKPLSPFPYTSFSDKYSGAKVDIQGYNGAEVDGSLHSILTVSISTKLFATTGLHSDVLLIRLVEFLVMKFMNEMKLIGLWKFHHNGQEENDIRCRLVFQSRTPTHLSANNTISAAYWSEEFSTMTVGDLMIDQRLAEWLNFAVVGRGEGEQSTSTHVNLAKLKVNDLLEISDFFNHPQRILSILQEANTPLHQGIVFPDSMDSVDHRYRLLQSLDPLHSTVTCILKDYLIADEDEMQVGLLTNLMEQVEESGMRLLGLRLVYLSSEDTAWKKHTSHHDLHFTSATLKTAAESSKVTKEPVWIPALCFAFSTTKATMNGGDRIRAILGPEDPILAKKTDPASIRACFGVNRDQNVAYSLPFAREKIAQELSFWFAPNSDVTHVSSKAHTLVMPSSRLVTIGVKILSKGADPSTVASSTSTTTANALALLRLQKSIVFDHILDKFQEFGLLDDFQTTNATAFASHFYSLSSAATVQNGVTVRHQSSTSSHSSSSQCFIASFTSLVSDLCIHKYWHELVAIVNEEVKKANSLLCPAGSVEVDDAGYCVHVALHYSSDSTGAIDVAPAAQTGSRLASLQAAKAVPKEDYKSHEDIGLSDTVVVQVLEPVVEDVSHHQHHAVASSWTQKVLNLLNLFPSTCHVQVLGAKTIKIASPSNDNLPNAPSIVRHKTLLVIRGYQIIENIDYVLQELQTSSAPNSPAMSSGAHKKFDSHPAVPSVFPITFSKGKKALELIFQEFAPQSLYLDLALQDLIDYVPLSQSFLQASTTPVTAPSESEATSSEITVERSIESIAKALFPPGNFQAIGLVILPWAPPIASSSSGSGRHTDTVYTRNLSRVLTRLEKEGFTILSVQSVKDLDRSILYELIEENRKEFLHQMNGSQVFAPLSPSKQSGSVAIPSSTSNAVQTQPVSATIVMTLRKSALLKLKTIMGPVFDDQLALVNYPRSLAALLASLAPSPAVSLPLSLNFDSSYSSSANSVASTMKLPVLLPVLTCRQNESVIRRYLSDYLPLFHQLQNKALLVDPYSPLELLEATMGDDGDKDEDEESRKRREEEVVKVVNQFMHTDSILEKRVSMLKSPKFVVNTKETADSLQVKTTNIAAIVITNALIQHHGLGVILETLHREGLWVSITIITHSVFCDGRFISF